MNTKIQALLTKEHATHWKPFVAEYVRLETANKAGASASSDYRIVKRGTNYEITWAGMQPYSPMDAETLYGWMQRLPLKYWADKADELRHALLAS